MAGAGGRVGAGAAPAPRDDLGVRVRRGAGRELDLARRLVAAVGRDRLAGGADDGDGRFCQMSFSAIWIAAAIGIATRAPSTPSSFAPIRIAVITASGCRFTARR